MIPRPLVMTGLLGAAVGVPYAVSHAPDAWKPNSTAAAPAEAPSVPAVNPALVAPPQVAPPASPGSEIYRSPALLEGRRNLPLDQLLHWNITKDWVYQGWARKSTGLADPGLFGVRVPVVTGGAMTDVAGALSYYFDNAGQLQRIRLHGRTADTTELVRLATTRFGLQPSPSATVGEQRFAAVEGKQTRSQLATRPEGVLWSTSPHGSFTVDLELNRPGSDFWVKPVLPELKVAGLPAPSKEAAAKPEEAPILPPKAVVPDADETKEEAAVEAQAEAEAPASETKETPDIAPLRGYRERFRWPE